MPARIAGFIDDIRRSIDRIAAAVLSRFPQPDIGRRGEAVAARHLRRRGLRILGRNLRARSGEIDIAALDGDTLVFVEVKSSVQGPRADPLDRIHPEKVRRIRRAAALYRKFLGEEVPACRIDGVAVDFARGFAGRAVPVNVRWYPGLYPLEDAE